DFIDSIFDESGARGSLEYNPEAATDIPSAPATEAPAAAVAPLAPAATPADDQDWQSLDVTAPIDGDAPKEAASTLAHMVEALHSIMAAPESSAPVTESQQPQPSPFSQQSAAPTTGQAESTGRASLFERLGGASAEVPPIVVDDAEALSKPTGLKGMLTAD